MNLNRRIFLGRIGAASAAAAIAAPAAPSAAAVPSVTATFSDIGTRADAAEARFLRADDAFKAAKAAAERLMPEPPDCLVVKHVTTPRIGFYEGLRRVDESPARWGEPKVFVLEQSYIHGLNEEYADLPKNDPIHRSPPAKRARKLMAKHKAWMAAKERVREETGFHAASSEFYYAQRDITKLAVEAFEHEAQSTADLLIQARALNSAASMPDGKNWAVPTLGPKLAMSVERVLGNAHDFHDRE